MMTGRSRSGGQLDWIKQLSKGKLAGSTLQQASRFRRFGLPPSIRSPCVSVTIETSLAKGRFLRCRALLVARTFEVSLHKLPAKPSFDTQVTMADIVVEGRSSFHNLIVLDVER
jgi:hypothetical protein